jgi:deoxyadenosine/deoxycytidine kinase
MVFLVCIDGMIGSGKSSLIEKLSNKYTCFQEPVEDWSLLQSMYKNMSDFAAPFQFQVLFSFHKIWSSIKNIDDLVVVERCPWSSKNIFTKSFVEDGFIRPEEYKVYCNFYDKIEYPVDVYMYLQVDTNVAHQRILSRNRSSEVHITLEYLCNLNRTYDEVFAAPKSMGQNTNVHVVDANRTMESVYEDVWQILKRVKATNR